MSTENKVATCNTHVTTKSFNILQLEETTSSGNLIEQKFGPDLPTYKHPRLRFIWKAENKSRHKLRNARKTQRKHSR